MPMTTSTPMPFTGIFVRANGPDFTPFYTEKLRIGRRVSAGSVGSTLHSEAIISKFSMTTSRLLCCLADV